MTDILLLVIIGILVPPIGVAMLFFAAVWAFWFALGFRGFRRFAGALSVFAIAVTLFNVSGLFN